MEYKGEGFVLGLATLGKGVPRVGYVGAGCTQGRVWLGEWLGWFVTAAVFGGDTVDKCTASNPDRQTGIGRQVRLG